MIKAETNPIVEGLRGAHASSIRDASVKVLREFMDEQRAILIRLADEADATPDGATPVLDAGGAAEKRAQLKQTMAALTEIAA